MTKPHSDPERQLEEAMAALMARIGSEPVSPELQALAARLSEALQRAASDSGSASTGGDGE